MTKFSAQDISETDPEVLIREIYAHIEHALGFTLAQRILKVYGGADHVRDVPEARQRACADRLLRLLMPTLEPLPPVKDAPVQAKNQLEAELARLRFAENKRVRREKAKALLGELYEWNFSWRMGDAVRGLRMGYRERRDRLSAAMCAHLEKNEEGVRDLRDNFEDTWADFQEDLMGTHYEDFAAYCRAGLIRMTVGTMETPCKRGLAELAFIMHGDSK